MNQIFRVAIAVSFLLVSACSRPPEPVEVSGVTELQATVVAVDAGERKIELEGSDGTRVITSVGADVRNLEQVEVGDTLNVRYYSGYVLAMAEPGEAGSDMDAIAGRALEGGRPAGMVGTTTRATVEVLSVEKDGKRVSFRDSEGRVRSVPIYREEVQGFAKALEQGDLVDVRFSDALTISIEPSEPQS